MSDYWKPPKELLPAQSLDPLELLRNHRPTFHPPGPDIRFVSREQWAAAAEEE